MNKFFLMGIFALFALSACTKDRVTGSGRVVTESRNVGGFTRIVTNGSTDVYVSQGTTFSVQLRGYENLLPYMETTLRGNALEIGYRNNVHVRNDNVEAFVTLPTLEGINISGSADVVASGNFSGSNLAAIISGSGNVTVAGGSAPLFTTNISGSGNIRAFGLEAQTVEAAISGSGNTEVKATDRLRVRISGSGSVYYKGQPLVESQVSGSGKVVPR